MKLLPLPVSLLLLFLVSCRLEKPDPASQAAAILHKHPSAFLDQLAALETLAAREAAGAAPGLEARSTLAESLYAYRARLAPLLAGAPDSARLSLLNAFVFDSLALEAVEDQGNLAASLPSVALRDRKAACLGLVLVYLSLGQSLDLPLYPVILPGHVFVRYRSGDYVRNVETLRRGLARSDSFYRATFALEQRPWFTLKDGEPRQALAALVFNLANTHLAGGDLRAAREEYRLVEEALPGFPGALGNHGAALLKQGDRPAALEKLLAALAGDSLTPAAWQNLAELYRAEGDSARAAWARGRDGRPGYVPALP